VGLILFILSLALAIALAPLILGAIGTMFALLFTFLLWAFAGFPDNTPKDTRPTHSQVAPADAESDPMEQLLEWERQDRQRARSHRVARRRRDEAALLDAQRRDAEAEEYGHEEP
jgi:hypothetical protein